MTLTALRTEKLKQIPADHAYKQSRINYKSATVAQNIKRQQQ